NNGLYVSFKADDSSVGGLPITNGLGFSYQANIVNHNSFPIVIDHAKIAIDYLNEDIPSSCQKVPEITTVSTSREGFFTQYHNEDSKGIFVFGTDGRWPDEAKYVMPGQVLSIPMLSNISLGTGMDSKSCTSALEWASQVVYDDGMSASGDVTLSAPDEVVPGERFSIDATGNISPENAVVSYEITQISGVETSISQQFNRFNVVTSIEAPNSELVFQVAVKDGQGNILDTEEISVMVNDTPTGGNDEYPVWVAGTTDPTDGDIYQHNGVCWEATNDPGSWDEPKQGWFWTEVSCD
ncbi:hypothetical protein N9R79_12605, partial [Vibrio sp.]|nr:hypothetical protein [Vibrio sp.]